MSKKEQAIPYDKVHRIGVYLPPDIARFVRINRALTGEPVTRLISRLLRAEMVRSNHRPLAD
jgi:hypothetical protein